jgi:hypothetical protein
MDRLLGASTGEIIHEIAGKEQTDRDNDDSSNDRNIAYPAPPHELLELCVVLFGSLKLVFLFPAEIIHLSHAKSFDTL